MSIDLESLAALLRVALDALFFWGALLLGVPILLAGVIALALAIWDRLELVRYNRWRAHGERLGTRPYGSEPMADPVPMDVIITLVHGTWAPNAEWTRDDSPLRTTVMGEFPGKRLGFHVLEWSGGNNICAREEAAEQLVADLRALAARHPEAMQVVAAHSHGGNVLMYAMRQAPDLHALVSGIICIATPFLHVRIRDLYPFDRKFVRAMLAVVVGVPLGLAARHLQSGAGGWAFWELGPNPAWMWLGALLAAGGALGYRLAIWGEGHAARLFRRLELPNAPLPPMLVVRAVADEASAALAVVFMLGLVSAKLWEAIARLGHVAAVYAQRSSDWLTRHVVHFWSTVTALLALGVLVQFLAAPGVAQGTLIAMLVLGGIALLAATIMLLPRLVGTTARVLVGFLMVPYAAFVSLLSASISPSLVVAGIYLDVVAETVPLGSHGVRLYDYRTSSHETQTVTERVDILVHSRLYSDQRVLHEVADWIRMLDRNGQ